MSSFDCEVIVIGGGVGELTPRELDVTDQSAVLAAGHEFLPDADVVQADAYNWKGDELAQGIRKDARPGQLMRFGLATQKPEGTLLFAGADLASGWEGRVDGAIESGHCAARVVHDLLGVSAV